MSEQQEDLFAPHVRWNSTFIGLDIALFTGAVSFSSWNTILPLFIRHLTTSNLLVGLMPAVRNLGLNLPPVFVSPQVARLHRYKPFVLWLTIMERVPFLLLALFSLWLSVHHPTIMVALFFLMAAIWSVGGGVTTPPWLNMVSLMIPVRLRGRFFGLSSGLGGLLGIGSAALTAVILRSFAFPTNFAICFLATFVMLVFSFIALASGREPPNTAFVPAQRSVRIVSYLRTLPAFLRRERNFASFLLASVLGNTCLAISPFITVAASRSLHVPDAQVGVYGVVLMATSTLGSLGWGWLGDHAGYRPVLVAGAVAGFCCMLLALCALGFGQAGFFYGAFALLGAYNSAVQLAAFAAVVEFGEPAERPTFIALSSLVQAPVALAAPVIGGLVADHLGYSPIFAGTGVALAAAAMLYVFKVRDPRGERVS